ncbi:hypothetical protein AXF42_Ash018542 [Apostasia shenzhenica]|uniref:Uncharacterized protein n=1 Tax=Apostasia shenzhenica TaxID=1088818 RepID=A0A2I0APT3_9ASPA|nr:hypothetical protein AXF42_Ash018542 [Apostasia shenzhenica]
MTEGYSIHDLLNYNKRKKKKKKKKRVMSLLLSRAEVVNESIVVGQKHGRKEGLMPAVGREGVNGSFSSTVKEEEEEEEEPPVGSSESSSIGFESSSEEESEEDEAESKLSEDGAFGCLDSIEESLPIKRGLSNFFIGKSKSFACLSEAAAAANAVDLAKPENPFNKRRRILMTSKAAWVRRASCSSLISSLPSLLSPNLIVKEGEEEEDFEMGGIRALSMAPLLDQGDGSGIHKSFKSPRSFSLSSDLQHV